MKIELRICVLVIRLLLAILEVLTTRKYKSLRREGLKLIREIEKTPKQSSPLRAINLKD